MDFAFRAHLNCKMKTSHCCLVYSYTLTFSNCRARDPKMLLQLTLQYSSNSNPPLFTTAWVFFLRHESVVSVKTWTKAQAPFCYKIVKKKLNKTFLKRQNKLYNLQKRRRMLVIRQLFSSDTYLPKYNCYARGKIQNCFNSNKSVQSIVIFNQADYTEIHIFENITFSVDELFFNSEIYILSYYLKNRKFFEDFYIPNLLLFDAALEQKA